MGILFLLWPILSIIILAMHFYRNGNSLAVLICLFLLLVFMIGRPWAARLLQICLALGAVELGRMTFVLIQARVEAGAPFLRLTFILGSVTLLTFASLLVFRTQTVRCYFKNNITAPSNERDDKQREV